jgi:hypothetical protein
MTNFYSSTERLIACALSSAPRLKKAIKNIYQYANWRIHKKPYFFQSSYPIQSICNEYRESFFGYYDKCPLSTYDSFLIYHTNTYPTRQFPDSIMSVEIVLQEASSGKLLVRLPSSSYNWQQGCRAHWLNNDLMVFNDFEEVTGNYVACVFSASNLRKVKGFAFPIQDTFGTDYFLSLNYRRLMALRPDYGYRNLPPLTKVQLADVENDGIWRIEYDSGKSQLLVSFADMCRVAPKSSFAAAIHKANHVMISPSGDKFIFLHRYYVGKRRFDRLMLANAETGDLRLLADYGIVSHCFWADENTILGYLRGPGNKDAYWLIDVATGNFTRFGDGVLDKYGDGHPHVHGDWFVTDTYPDKARMQHLILANWKTGEFRELGEFFHGFEYSGETRCDLHPRFSPDGKSVFFDSVFDGKRRLYRMDLES